MNGRGGAAETMYGAVAEVDLGRWQRLESAGYGRRSVGGISEIGHSDS